MSDTDRPQGSEDQGQRPRYGEYAPGYTPPSSGATADQQPPSAAASPAWASQHPHPAQPYGAPQRKETPDGRPRRTWDVVLTVILLALGLVGTGIALVYAGGLSDPALLDAVFRQQGRGGFDGRVGSAPLVIVVSHLALLLAAVGLSILFLAKRLVAFWIPLVAGVIAALVFWGALLSVVMSDPAFMSRYGS